jgi:sugar lactone lactonase YvrE
MRIAEGGVVLQELQVDLGQLAYACMLGGDDRRTLYVCASAFSDRTRCQAQHTGRILTTRVDVPGAGLP